ncbi:MAG TPA: lysylphosphatidylglycerol synthase transmembrane domain-containing protein [Candidatus Krumholzibacteria bacterium]|nr:lysylphosphatidylglycerol synthase transmembrane domain-containing protein [Candidatus Krumholzibacteria bacterium]
MSARVGGALRWAVKITVSVSLMAFLFHKIPTHEITGLAARADRGLLLAATLVFLASNVAGWFQWHTLLRSSGVRLSHDRTFRFYFIGLFFNNFLPANIGGDAVKVYDLSREGESPYQMIAVTLLDRLLGVFSLCLLAIAAELLLVGQTGAMPHALYLGVFVACMIPALGFYFVRPLGNWLRRSVLRLRALSLDARMTAIIDHLSPFRGRRMLVMRLVLLSGVIQAMRVVTHILVGMALGIPMTPVTVAQFFVFIPILSLAMIPPITINGLGIREGLGILLFAEAGIQRADAFVLEFATYIISVVVSLVGFVFFLGRRTGRPRA